MPESSTPASSPYQPPRAELHAPSAPDASVFIPGGRRVPRGYLSRWFRLSWRQFADAPGTWCVITIVYLVVLALVGEIPRAGALVVAFLTPIVTGGIMIGCARRAQGGVITLDDMWGGFGQHGVRLAQVGLAAALLRLVVSAIGYTMFFGSAGLSIAFGSGMSLEDLGGWNFLVGILFVEFACWAFDSLLFGWAPYLVTRHNVALLPAIQMTLRAAVVNFWPLTAFGLVFLLLFAVGGVVTLGLGILLIVPLDFTSTYVTARDIYAADELG